MTAVFRLDASIRREGSASRALADDVTEVLATNDLGVVRRDLVADPVPATAWADSLVAGFVPEDGRTPEQREARALVTTLADELERADGYVFGSPLYNWGVSQHVKTWVDAVMTDPRFGPRSNTIGGRPAVLIIARGGDYRDGSERADWDHATAWLHRIVEDVWHLDVTTIEVGFTLAPVREHMAHLRDLAAEDLSRAHREATSAGAWLVESLRRADAA